MKRGQPVFRTEGLSVRYGGVVANDDVSLCIEPGQIVGLIGPNGAGKSTFIDAVTGFTRSTGAIHLDGRPLEKVAPHRRTRLGLARTWQSIELFQDLSVYENVLVSMRQVTARTVLADLVRPGRQRDDRAVWAALELLGLASKADQRTDELSLGQRKLLGVARALAADPRVVLLDEPAAGLDTAESRELGRRLRDVVTSGTSILLVDHDMGLVLDVCDTVYVLEFGRIIAQGPPEAIRSDPAVIAAYLGGGQESLDTAEAPGDAESEVAL